MANREWRIQLKDGLTGASIVSAGGTVQVCTAGTPTKATIYDKDGAAMTNPLTPTRGFINFFVVDTVDTVDLYVQAPTGQYSVSYSVSPSGPNEIVISTARREQTYIIPFSITDATAATEKDTGFDLPAQAIVLDRLHGLGVRVTTLDSGQNILFGLLSTESGGDADGFSTNVSLTSAILKIAVNGALFSSNAPHLSDALTAKSISYTLDTSTDTGKGFIIMPVVLPAVV